MFHIPDFSIDSLEDRFLLFQLGLNPGFRGPKNLQELNSLLQKFVPPLPKAGFMRLAVILGRLGLSDGLDLLLALPEHTIRDVCGEKLPPTFGHFSVDTLYLIDELRQLPLETESIRELLIGNPTDEQPASPSLQSVDATLAKLAELFSQQCSDKRCEFLRAASGFRVKQALVKRAL